MIIAGFQKMTLLDYPGKIAALIFTQGCNFACGYCHNPEMIPQKKSPVSEHTPQSVLGFLKTRKGMLDGLVISGGEPTLHEDLEDFIKEVKQMGFLVKLDTNGSNPEVLKKLYAQNLVDFVAMDLKHRQEKHHRLTKNNDGELIMQSIELVKNSGIPYEFRSTILPAFHSPDDIKAMGKMIQGAKNWHLQNFRSIKTFDKKLGNERSFSSSELVRLQKIAQKYADHVELR